MWQMLLVDDTDHYLCSKPNELEQYTWNDPDMSQPQDPKDIDCYESGELGEAVKEFLLHVRQELDKVGLPDLTSKPSLYVAVREVGSSDWVTYRIEYSNTNSMKAVDGGL